jgi:hypothetical protein
MSFNLVFAGEKIACSNTNTLRATILEEAAKYKVLQFHATVRYKTPSGMTKNQFISVTNDNKILYTYGTQEEVDMDEWENQLNGTN